MALVTEPPPLHLRTSSPDQTRAVAAVVAGACLPGDILLLAGDLGAGKTTFAQGFAAGLGVAEPVTSPTFTLVREYPVPGDSPVRIMLHADVWRLEHLHEIVDLGLGALVEDGAVALVEWGDAAEPLLGDDALAVELVADGVDGADRDDGSDGDDQRAITVRNPGPRWAARWDALVGALAGWRVAT
jgi:tRNA threonylcarbamoyladenosine biosynthesis protein TsaE